MDDVGDLDFFLGDECFEGFFERGCVEEFYDSESVTEFGEKLRSILRVAETFVERFFVVSELVVGDKEIVVVEDVAGDLDAIASRFANLTEVWSGVTGRWVADIPSRLKERQHLGDLLLEWQLLHCAVLERDELLRIEAGRGLVDPLEREVLDHCFAREVLGLVVERPAQQRAGS